MPKMNIRARLLAAFSCALVIMLIAVLAALVPDRSATSQDQTEERLAALEATVESQGNRISNLSGRVKDLEEANAPAATEPAANQASEKSGPFTMIGSGNSSQTERFGAGTYQTDGVCSSPTMFVYVTNEANGTNIFAISMDGNDELFAPVVIVESADYLVEVFCDGEWEVSFE